MDTNLIWEITKAIIAIIFSIFIGAGVFFYFSLQGVEKRRARKEKERKDRWMN